MRRLQGDGASAISRRTTTSTNKSGGVHDAIKAGKWVIPIFPPGWKDAVGEKLFKVMTEWRKSAIHQHALQKALDTNFGLKVTRVGKKRDHRTARHTKSETPANADGDEDMQDQDDGTSKRRRITLLKSRRVVTETDADA